MTSMLVYIIIIINYIFRYCDWLKELGKSKLGLLHCKFCLESPDPNMQKENLECMRILSQKKSVP